MPQQRRPATSEGVPRRKPRARKKPPTPGPGSYNMDTSQGSIGGRGFVSGGGGKKESRPAFSFGTSDRFAYMGQHVSKRHSKSSSFFGRHSPGPATYNTRGKSSEGPSWSQGTDINRPSPFKGSTSPGPVYWPSLSQTKSRTASYSMGSGHVFGDGSSVVSPGPVYDTRERPGSGSAIVAGLPTYKFGSSKARPDNQNAGKTPGPDRYRPSLQSSKKNGPRFSMYETYGWRAKKGQTKPPRSASPAALLTHSTSGVEMPSFSFGQEERFDFD